MSGQFGCKKGDLPKPISVNTAEGVVSFSPDAIAWLESMQVAGKIDKWEMMDPRKNDVPAVPGLFIHNIAWAVDRESEERPSGAVVRRLKFYGDPYIIRCKFSFLNIYFILSYFIINDENDFTLSMCLHFDDDGIKYEELKGNVDNNNIIIKLLESSHKVKTFDDVYLNMKNLMDALREHVDIVAKKQIEEHTDVIKNLRGWN
jgi:hypothetical protein